MSGSSSPDRQMPVGDAAGRTVYYDEHSDTYHAWAEDDESISTVVVLAVSTVRDADPDSLMPLARRLDPDALDAIFVDRPNGVARTTEGLVSFSFADCHVTVRASGEIVIEVAEAPTER